MLQRGEADGGQPVGGENVEQVGGEVRAPGEGPADVVGLVLREGDERFNRGAGVAGGFAADGVVVASCESGEVFGGGVGVAGEQAVGPGPQGEQRVGVAGVERLRGLVALGVGGAAGADQQAAACFCEVGVACGALAQGGVGVGGELGEGVGIGIRVAGGELFAPVAGAGEAIEGVGGDGGVGLGEALEVGGGAGGGDVLFCAVGKAGVGGDVRAHGVGAVDRETRE